MLTTNSSSLTTAEARVATAHETKRFLNVRSFGIALNSTTRRHPRLGLVAGSRGLTQIHIRGLCHWAGEPAGHLSAARVTEPTNRRARKRQENKPVLSTVIARIAPGAVRECDAPVPPYSAFRHPSSLSYWHAWPFAVAKATQAFTRNRTSPVAVEEPPSSRDPATRPLRRSPRHP